MKLVIATRSTQNVMIASLAVCIPLQLLESGDEYGGEHEVESSLPGMIITFPYLLYQQQWLKCLRSRKALYFNTAEINLLYYSVDTALQL